MVIVAAVDSSERSSYVLDQAATLAKRFDEPVHAIHVMTRSEAINAETSSITSDDAIEIEELRATAAQVASDALEDQPDDVETEAVGRIGDPATEIVEYANEHDTQYIVVSPRRRSQTGKIIFGSVAQSILLDATCPVVSVTDESSR
ncbi:universal stress protein [Haloarcula sp. CBA1130]|uniref:Universal stress protein n=1 Tax=Haloarcula terrestris TaxID=2950533 RepID=A0AAE4F269_9EURY|nr:MULTISPECIES: universal stress protein [Haloarcula]KAA9396334.1 universal stress protein [Haloarcula sp. CBA1130]KAA9398313.1 universal stress protein [Haloarcula sp. CBA1129]MDS0223569.1 universal stress protein [Haloarcula terrestris]